MHDILITPQFRKDLKTIPTYIKLQADEVVTHLRSNPTDIKLVTKKLKGFNPAIWRIRIGMYRLVYIFDKNSITLLRFLHRKDVYRNL